MSSCLSDQIFDDKFERCIRARGWGAAVIKGGTEKWDALRKIYEMLDDDIRARHPRQIDPYFVDWMRVFTPIERDAWDTIRPIGLPMLPQYPVLKVFLDFADPVKKVGIECDGSKWHQDKSKDERRDKDLIDCGWTIYRIPGYQCRRGGIDLCDLHEGVHCGRIEEDEFDKTVIEWLRGTSDGVIHAIASYHYGKRIGIEDRLYGEIMRALEMHRFRMPEDWYTSRTLSELLA